ncbi:3-dehydroquinate synthase [Jeotgalibacillus sp. S-D1]|uniref:3-dehydroquinate synthase n=1 Tax=Jeotgalibacillus sp. S-D1 TaxID=2552189 RepID=UPI00105A3FFA|nr:3-dehydroquinate synthase [Jeotgalibacillus sp. S-D1]TDL34736.1 3-dehydroquinate synthase [Jeotgalibacillus sp. S-D1]
METISIKTTQSAYPVYLGQGAIKKLPEHINRLQPAVTSIMYIVDETVNKLHRKYIEDHLPVNGQIHWYVTPSGESAKTFEVYQEALGEALMFGLDRHSLIVACGGGATGDLAGFVAASFMRGIRFVQVPTTILAHDSSVGGKVAINHPLGKNMVGSFHQPAAVIYDVLFLATLPEREVRSGFAEVIKHALIADPAWLNKLIREIPSLKSIPLNVLTECLKKGIEIKSSIVEQDEKELGIRAHLNFGHTYGHAIEAWAGYGKWTHGESIMAGMIYALMLSEKINHLQFDLHNFIHWVTELGYETSPPADASFDELLFLMLKDKKNIANEIRFVLLKKPGEPIVQQVDIEDLKVIDNLIRDAKGEIQ